ncbi:transposase [Myxococcus stipitatus]|uniref:transposase n=1 Tax=Myxococcus stipitatus TaxID=83455 RepID=UPI0032547AC3
MPDELWTRMEPFLPGRPTHPLGCHNPRVPDKLAVDAILLVLCIGMKWGALEATDIRLPSSVYGASVYGCPLVSSASSGSKG